MLIGTTSVERSEYLSRQFQKRRIPHNVLNAKYHEQEAGIIAEAGRRGAITVATNMAGRGTDIVLGGNVDFLADLRLREQGLDPVETAEEYEAAWHEELPKVKAEAAAEAEEVRDAGGLYVLGTERHESRRIDNQLRGRSGRQGDPGESRFYLSLGDELMRRFNGATLESLMTRLKLPDDVPIEAKMVTRAIKSAQTQVEQQNFEIRKNVLKYDEVMNQQRKVIYDERRRILEGENLQEQVHDMIVDVITAYVDGATAEGYAEDWDLDSCGPRCKTLYPVGIDHHDLIDSDAVGEPGDLTREELLDALIEDAEQAYAEARSRARGARRRGRDAPARAQRAAQRPRPQVARAPLRDGLPQGGHRPARDGAARPAGRVPARGLRHVRRHARRRSRRSPSGSCSTCRSRRCRTRRRWRRSPRRRGWPSSPPRSGAQEPQRTHAARAGTGVARQGNRRRGTRQLTYTGPAEDGSAQVQGNGGKHAAPAGAAARSAARPRDSVRRTRRRCAAAKACVGPGRRGVPDSARHAVDRIHRRQHAQQDQDDEGR